MRCEQRRQGGRGSKTAYIRAEASEPAKIQEPLKRPLRPRQCNKHLQKELAAAFPQIVAGFIGEAYKGGCAHMKLAVDLLDPAKDEGRRRKGSAQRLLEELGD